MDKTYKLSEVSMEGFKDKVAVVTGGANGIGKCIAEEFRKAGALVCIIDKASGDHFVGDISDKTVLESFVESVINQHGHIDYLINNALPLMKDIDECSYEEFRYALDVGVTAPFYLSKDPDELVLFEVWSSPEAVQSHMETDHYRKLMELKKEFVVETTFSRYDAEQI